MSTWSNIHDAARSCDVHLIGEILKKNPESVNKWDHKYKTPLHVVFDSVNHSAQESDVLRAVQFLLDNGADVNAFFGTDKRTALLLAIITQQTSVTKLLLQYGAKPNKCPLCIYWIVYHIRIDELLKLLLSHGADTENLFRKQHYDFADNLVVYSTLLDLGNRKVHYFYEMIKAACINGKDYIIKFLLKNSDTFHPNGRFSLKELKLYVELNPGRESLFLLEEVLKDWHYGIEQRINDGTLLLHYYIQTKNYNSAQLLLKSGKNINETNANGDTAFHLLFRQKESEESARFNGILRCFLESGADISVHNCFNQTPFSLAVIYSYHNAINLMLAAVTGLQEDTLNTIVDEINQDCEDIHYKVPIEKNSFELYIAIYLNYVEVVDRLIDIGCNKKNPFYITYAVSKQRYQITKLLYEANFQSLKEEYPYKVPRYPEHDEEKLKLLSLVWTFDKSSILKLPLTYILCWFESMKKLRELHMFILFFALDLDAKQPNYTYNQLKTVPFLECANPFKVIHLLKANNLCKNKKLYDVLMMDFDALVIFLNDPDNFNDCSTFCKFIEDLSLDELEYYEIILFEKISLALERRKLWDGAAFNLNILVQDCLIQSKYHNLPDEILRKIFSYLSPKDLRNIKLEEVPDPPPAMSRTRRFLNFLKIPFFRRNQAA